MKPRILLVGAGHAHVEVLRSFAEDRPNADVRILTDGVRSYYSGMLPGFIAGRYSLDDLSLDVAGLAQRADADLQVGRMTALDVDRRKVELEDGREYRYDIVSLNVGAVSGQAHDSLSEAPVAALRPIAKFLPGVAQLADRLRRGRRLIVVGGGAAGVELAIAFSSHGRGVTLAEAGGRLVPEAPARLSNRVLATVKRRGVDVRLRTRVEGNAHMATDAVVWATPAQGGGRFAHSGLECDGRGFVRVSSTLQTKTTPECFAVGDCAVLIEAPKLPRSGAVAVRQGPVLAHNLRQVVRGGRMAEFRPRTHYLTLLDLGEGEAAGFFGTLYGTGRWVMRLKTRIDRKWLNRYRLAAVG